MKLTTRLAGAAPALVLLALFAALTIYPVARFLLLPWLGGPSTGVSHLGAVSAEALVNSVRIGLESTTLAVAFGIPIAWLLERRRWALGPVLILVLWLVFATPSYLMTTGWQIVFSQTALVHGPFASAFFAEPGIVFLLALKGLPFSTLAARTSWRAIGAELQDAARLLVPSALGRRLVILQLLSPAAAAAFAVVFIETIQEFGVPATLGAQVHLPIVTYAIYERLATTPVDFPGAAGLSWQLVGLALLAVAAQLWFASRFAGALVHGRRREPPRPPCSPTESALAATALTAIAAAGLAAPFLAMVLAALGGTEIGQPVDWSCLLYSSLYGLVAALAAVALVAPVLLRRRAKAGAASSVIGALSLVNMALPGVVLGAAYVIAFNEPWLPLYGTPVLLIAAYVAVQAPMLLRFLQAPVDQVHPNLSEAGRLHGLPFAVRLLDIDAPLLTPAFVWGGMMAFTQVFFELPISELLYPAGRAPVGVALVQLNQSLDYAQEARLALAAIATALAIAGGVGALVRWLFAAPQPAKAPA